MAESAQRLLECSSPSLANAELCVEPKHPSQDYLEHGVQGSVLWLEVEQAPS